MSETKERFDFGSFERFRCSACDGVGGRYDAGDGMEWDCERCWGNGIYAPQFLGPIAYELVAAIEMPVGTLYEREQRATAIQDAVHAYHQALSEKEGSE